MTGNTKKEVLEVHYKNAKEKFIEKANQVYLSAKSLVDVIHQNDYAVDRLYINAFHRNPKVLIVVDEDLILNDDFVEFAYSKIHEMQCSFHSLFSNTLDLSLIGKDGLDEELLKSDGFEYSEKF